MSLISRVFQLEEEPTSRAERTICCTERAKVEEALCTKLDSAAVRGGRVGTGGGDAARGRGLSISRVGEGEGGGVEELDRPKSRTNPSGLLEFERVRPEVMPLKNPLMGQRVNGSYLTRRTGPNGTEGGRGSESNEKGRLGQSNLVKDCVEEWRVPSGQVLSRFYAPHSTYY